MRVLIVAADVDERARAATALPLHDDVEVVEAAGGTEAAQLLRSTGFDVLIVDGDLHPKGGFSWLYELRAEAQLVGGTRPPAIVMTSRPQDGFLATWSGAEVVVAKPVDGFAVADAVRRLGAATEAPA